MNLTIHRKVLVVDLSNQYRGPLIEAVLTRMLGETVQVDTGGTLPTAASRRGAAPVVVKTLERLGLKTEHQTRHIMHFDLPDYTHLVFTGAQELEHFKLLLPSAHEAAYIDILGGEQGVPRPNEHSGRQCLALCGWVHNELTAWASKLKLDPSA